MFKDILKWQLNLNKEKTPPHLIIYVTDYCNLRCNHCYFWKNLNKKNNFSLNEFTKISKSLNQIIWLDIGGGEPFLRDDLDKIIDIFYKNNKLKYVNIPTNGFLVDKIVKITESIVKKCPNTIINISISLDGKKDTHDKIRGVKGSFNKAITTLEKLVSLKENYPNLYISACTTIINKNYKEIIPLMEFTKKQFNLNFHGLNLVRGSPKDKSYGLPDYENLKKVLVGYQKNIEYYYHSKRGLNSINAFLGSRMLNFLNKYNLETTSKKKIIIPCLAGSVSAVINPNGDILICELTNKIVNIKDYDFNFKKAWNSKDAKEKRKLLPKKGCFCTHASFQNRNMLFNPWLMLKTIIINPKL